MRIVEEYIGRLMELTPEESDALYQEIEIRSYDKKARLIEIDDTEEYLHFVAKGLIRKFVYKVRQEINTQLATEGELIFSSVSYFTGQPSGYVIETIEPSTVYSLNKHRLVKLYKRFPRFQKLNELIITELLIKQELWELERIRYSTKERFLRFIENNWDLMQRTPQKILASYLKIQPETYSRLKHLTRKTTKDKT